MTQSDVNVCLVSKLFAPAYSGAAARFERYLPGLRSRGVCVSVMTTTLNTDLGKTVRPGEWLPADDLNGTPVHRVHLTDENQFGRAVLDYFRQPGNRPDVIQLLNLPPLPSLFSLRRLGIPLIFNRTIMSEFATNSWKDRLHRLRRRLQHYPLDCVVVNSVAMRDSLQKIGVKTPIEVIPNGLNLNRFRPVESPEAKQNLRRQLGLDPDAEIILFVGSLSPRKGVDTLAEAWRLLAAKRPRAYLLLVGPRHSESQGEKPAPEFEARLADSIACSGAEDRVIFTGSVSNVEQYYQAADIFVFPSHREGFPNAVLEAYGCALPVILTPFIGLSEECGRSGEHYLLVQREPDALAQAILICLDNPEQRRKYALNALQWVTERLNVEVSIDQYTALYRGLTDRFMSKKRQPGL